MPSLRDVSLYTNRSLSQYPHPKPASMIDLEEWKESRGSDSIECLLKIPATYCRSLYYLMLSSKTSSKSSSDGGGHLSASEALTVFYLGIFTYPSEVLLLKRSYLGKRTLEIKIQIKSFSISVQKTT